MQKTLPILWFILAGVSLLLTIGISAFAAMRGMGAAGLAQVAPYGLMSLAMFIALGIGYMVFLRVAPQSAAGILGVIHWVLALLSTLANGAAFLVQHQMMASGDIQTMGLIMGIAFGASAVTNILGWLFFIGAAAVTLGSVKPQTYST